MMPEVAANLAEPCVGIPRVGDFAWGDWTAAERVMRTGARVVLGQSWREVPSVDFQPGETWLGVSGEDLVVYAVLRDEAPANAATRWNEPTWLTGDVLELFFQAEGRAGYYEFHVTPENQRLQLFFPSSAAFQERRGIAHWAIAESRFESATRVDEARNGWEVLMRIKLALVLDEAAGVAPAGEGAGEEAGTGRREGAKRFRFTFSRYDYQPGREKPVLSASARFSRPDFHHVPEWSWAEIAGG